MRVAIHFCLLFILLFVITSLTFTSSLTTDWQLPTIHPTIVDFEPCSAFNLTKKDFCFLPPSFRREEAKKKQNKNSRSPSELLNTPNTTTSHLRMTLGSFVVRSMCFAEARERERKHKQRAFSPGMQNLFFKLYHESLQIGTF